MNHLERLARRVRDDPRFLALVLAFYAESERLDDAALAARLGCPPENLPMLRLCRAPDPAPAVFQTDIARIAARFGADPDTLAAAVRRGEVLVKFRAANFQDCGTLMAARDGNPGKAET
jgi:hypothetical protein